MPTSTPPTPGGPLGGLRVLAQRLAAQVDILVENRARDCPRGRAGRG